MIWGITARIIEDFAADVGIGTMLFVAEQYRGHGYGKRLMEYWEQDMNSQWK